MLQKRTLCLFLLAGIFMKAGSQVNLQTGSATFSLPMFQWKDDKSRLNSLIALSYNSGNGLRVNDAASNVGQGWTLVSGGVITRMQVGEPDDQVAYEPNGDADTRKYPAGILYATVPAYNGCPNALTKYPIYPYMNQRYTQHNTIAEDKQLDYFSFQFNGKAGMFVVDPANLGTCRMLGDSKMIISFQEDGSMISQGIRTKITSFTIKDNDGLIYKFTVHGLTKILKAEYCDKNLNRKQEQPKFKNNKVYHQAGFDNGEIDNPYIIDSWYLSEIEDALTSRKITYTYTVPKTINNPAGEDISYNQDNNYSIISHKTAIVKMLRDSIISYPDGHTVMFNYGNERLDMKGDKVLSSIDIAYNGRYLSKYQLGTSYFILNRYGTPTSAYQKRVARLCLRSVKKIGVDFKEDTPPYLFDYYLGSNTSDDFVPPPFFYAKDPWGFYNGNSSKQYDNNNSVPLDKTASDLNNVQLRGLCFKHTGVSGVYLNAKSGYAKNGLLRQVVYPTSGTLTYEYDQNTGVLNGSSTTVGGVHVSKTISADGGYSNGCSNAVSTQYNYVLSNGSSSSLWGLEMPVNTFSTNTHYQPEWKSWHWTTNCLLGCCYWHYEYPGILSQQQAINLPFMTEMLNTLSPVLGIMSVVGTIKDIITVIGGGNIGSLLLDIFFDVFSLVFTCVGDHAKDYSATVYFNSDMNSVAPLPVQFKRVEVVENPGTIGKTVQEFTSSDDYSLWELTNPYYSAKQRFAPWAYGLPKTTTIYDANGYPVKQTINKYDTTYSKSIINYCWQGHPGAPCNNSGLSTNLVSCKCLVINNTSQRSDNWSNPSSYNSDYHLTSDNNLKVDFYGMYTGRTNLDTTYERVFMPNSSTQFVETFTKYLYNNTNNYDVNQVLTQQSNGDINYKNIKYSSDYSGGALTTLVQNNIVSLPVETNTSVYKAGGGSLQYLNETVTEFSQISNGDIKPARVIEQRFAQPVASGSMTFYQGPGSNTSNYKVPQTFTFDGSGNLIGLKDEGNRLVTNIYDYNDKYISASIINADPSSDKTAYTSFETTSFGKWVLGGTGLPTYNTGTSITGSRSYNLPASKNLHISLNTGMAHTLSYWATGGTGSVSTGSTLVKSGPTINGFTYYEYDIAQGTSTINVNGLATIDELRIYPKNARMRTSTYDVVLGKTSDCDENNRITYYEYDNLGRQRFIKDESKNILKMFEYNNVSGGKQNGCPGTYYNHAVSEIFYSSVCGSGYQPAPYTYTVAANTYSSTISQADADAQAENYILIHGQADADTYGTCQLLYYNSQQSQSFTTQNCPPGYIGGSVTYTVAANTYSSTVSQQDANDMALDDIDANGQAYANSAAHAVCNTDTNPDWQWLEGAASYCLSVGGNLPPHLFVLETDMNPNSATYLQTRWSDTGANSVACPSNTYYNSAHSQSFTRNNCGSGYTGSSVTYTVAAGTYSSTTSQAAADQLALNDISANGQAYANSHGTCTQNGCNSSNCIGNNKKCVNNYCETGIKIYTSSEYDTLSGTYTCVYHYEWSDSSWSQDYTEYNNDSPCDIG
ncbi:MAG TPA: DUF5977 domain-containing protein [Chitinophagaceae bacterium]|nr:DUF5977 domain-containing protein [Chitinophagaceae bacterium]